MERGEKGCLRETKLSCSEWAFRSAALPRSSQRDGWHRLRRCSRASPLPQDFRARQLLLDKCRHAEHDGFDGA